MKKSHCALFLPLLFVLSCDFVSDDSPFTTVAPPDGEGLSIHLNNYNDTGVQLKVKTEFNYTIEAKGGFVGSEVRLDDDRIYSSSIPAGTFTLDPKELSTGTHNLKITFSARSASGSLADKVGAEIVSMWKEYSVIVSHDIPDDPDDPDAIRILSVEHVDHSILVKWNKYSNFNFEKYELIREYTNNQGSMSYKTVAQFTKADSLKTFDRTYRGGASAYKIKLYADGKSYTSPAFTYEHPYKPNITSTLDNLGTFTISWNSLEPLKANFDGYKVSIGSGKSYVLQSLQDTVITFATSGMRFGDVFNLKLYMSSTTIYEAGYGAKLMIGSLFPEFGYPLKYDNLTNKFYFLKSGKLAKADVISGEVTTSASGFSTYRGAINKTSAFYSDGASVYRIDLGTMQQTFMEGMPEGIVVSASDNDQLVMVKLNKVALVDASGNQILDIGTTSGERGNVISPDGMHVIGSSNIYLFNGVSYDIQAQGWNTYSVQTVDFLPGDIAVVVRDESLMKIDLSTGKRMISTQTYNGPCNYDPVSAMLGCTDNDRFLIIDPENFGLIKTYNVRQGNSYQLINDAIVCSTGCQIKLEDIP
jgi:hypothetical protein